MVFRSKVDTFLLILLFFVVAVMGSIPLFPIFKGASLSVLIITAAFFICSFAFLLWYGTSIKYVFCEDYLLIKGGPFKSKILYQNITKVSSTTAGFTGYRISSSDKGLELVLKSARFRSIKILPKDKMEFISELRKRCPHTLIQKFE